MFIMCNVHYGLRSPKKLRQFKFTSPNGGTHREAPDLVSSSIPLHYQSSNENAALPLSPQWYRVGQKQVNAVSTQNAVDFCIIIYKLFSYFPYEQLYTYFGPTLYIGSFTMDLQEHCIHLVFSEKVYIHIYLTL